MLTFISIFLLLIVTVITTHLLKNETKTKQLQTLSQITTPYGISLSTSHWETTELAPCLETINYTDFTYAK